MKTKIIKNQKGIAALITVVIIAAVSLVVAYSAFFLGLGELDLGYTAHKAGQAMSLADGCLEETLRRIRLNTDYGLGLGPINLSVDGNLCIIEVVDLGADRRRVTVTGRVGDYYKKLEAELTLTNNLITLDTWLEKSD